MEQKNQPNQTTGNRQGNSQSGSNRERDDQGRFAEDNGNNQRHAGGRSNADNNPGNFANDRDRAAEAGRKGGQNSHRGSSNDE